MDNFFLHFLREAEILPIIIVIVFIIDKRFSAIDNKLGMIKEIFNKKFEMVDNKLAHISKDVNLLEKSINKEITHIQNELDDRKSESKEISKLIHDNKIELARLKDKANIK